MHIFQRIVLIRELDAEGFRKAVAEIMAGAGLQRLSVMHQRFYGISSHCARKFLFICLLVITQILISISLLETRYIISLEQEKNRVLELQDMVFALEELDYNYDTYIEVKKKNS